MPLSTAVLAALQNIRAQRAKGLRPKMPRIKTKAGYPHTAEEAYRAAGAKTMLAVVAAGERSLDSYQRWVAGYHRDAFSDEWSEALATARAEADGIFKDDSTGLAAHVKDAGAMVSDLNLKGFTAQLSALAGTKWYPNGEPWVSGAIDDWSSANYELVHSLSSEYIGKLNAIVRASVEGGLDVSEFRDKIAALADNMTGWRVQLLARDQVGKLNGALSKRRQRDAGVDQYEWETAGDERVRGRKKPATPNHWIMQGRICRWDDSTVVKDGDAWVPRSSEMPRAIPGEDILCRCVGIPSFTEAWAQAEKADAQERGESAPKAAPKAAPAAKHGQALDFPQNDRAFRDATEAAAKAIKAAESSFIGTISNPDSKSACYYPGVRGIDMHDVKPGDANYDAVWRHEFGHHMDFAAGPGRDVPWSETGFPAARLNAISSRLGRASVTAEGGGQFTISKGAKSLQAALTKQGFDVDALKDFFSDVSNHSDSARPALCATWLARGDYVTFARAFFGVAPGCDGEITNFYDIFNAITKGRDFTGHSDSYWRSYAPSRGCEIFANLTSLLNGPRKETWRRLLNAMVPDLVKNYDECIAKMPEKIATTAGKAAPT